MLVDFGVARELGASDSGTVGVGTPRYMAPEVFAGGAVSPRARRVRAGRDDVDADHGHAARLRRPDPAGRGLPRGRDARARGGPASRPRDHPRAARGVDRARSRRRSARRCEPATGRVAGAVARAAGRAAQPDRGRRADRRRRLRGGGRVDRADRPHHRRARLPGRPGGPGAREIVGVRLPPGVGIAGSVVADRRGIAVPDCRNDPRFAAQIAAGTGYVPNTMLVVPLLARRQRRSACCRSSTAATAASTAPPTSSGPSFAELAVTALDVQPDVFTSLGEAELGERRRSRPSPGAFAR